MLDRVSGILLRNVFELTVWYFNPRARSLSCSSDARLDPLIESIVNLCGVTTVDAK